MYQGKSRGYQQYDTQSYGQRQQFQPQQHHQPYQQQPVYHKVNKDDTLKQLLSNQQIKQRLLDYVYDVIEPQKFKYKILRTPEDLQELQTNRFYISGNYAGAQCFLVFCKNKDRYYQFVINKKTLTYQQNKINIDAVQLDPVLVGLDGDIYDGTIFDGILSQTEPNAMKTFIITDVYYLKGTDMTKEKVKYKLLNIREYLKNNLNPDKNLNDIDLMVNNLSELCEIEKLVNEVIPKTKDIPIKGITFYPHVSGQKLIYLFSDRVQKDIPPKREFVQQPMQQQVRQMQPIQQARHMPPQQPMQQQRYQQFQQRQVVASPEFKQPEKHITPEQREKVVQRFIRKSSIDQNEQIILTFDIRKTEQSDVYKLLLVAEDKSSGKTTLKTKRVGIAYIPTAQCSKMCKDLTITNGRALIKCKFSDDKEKWIPIECDKSRKCPDFFSKLEEKIDIIMDEE